MPDRLRGILALLLVTAAWGATFPAMKDLSAHFSATSIIVVRFGLAGLLLSPCLRRAKSTDLLPGLLLGLTLFTCYLLQLRGLALTSSNRNAFITGLNVLVVPLLGLAAGRFPERKIVIAIMLAVAGLFALCWDGSAWNHGDTLALAGAFGFGCYITMLEFSARRSANLLALTTIQIIVVALCGLAWWPSSELPAHPQAWEGLIAIDGADLANFLFLTVFATAAMMPLQTWGQARSEANEAAVIYAFEPACAAIAGYFWLGETMAWRGVLGAALLIAGMIVSQWSSRGNDARFASG